MQQTVPGFCTDGAHMIGQLEAFLEGAGGNAAMQVGPVLGLLAGVFGFARGNQQLPVTQFDGQFILAEAGDGNRNAVFVLA